jgi:hypothetical protein
MGGFKLGVLVGSILVCAACTVPPKTDLALNDKLYRRTGYQAKVPADRKVCILPIVDERQAPVADAASAFPTTFVRDGRWERPVAAMLDELLRDEIERSGVFAAVVDAPSAEVCLLRVTLHVFEGGIQEVTTGRRTFASTRLLVELEGPQQGGARPQLLREPFGQHMQSDVVMMPPSPLVLLGSCLRIDVQNLLAKIDQSNVARSAVAGPGR